MAPKDNKAEHATSIQDSINSAIYRSSDVVKHYQVRGLDVAEAVTLLKYQPAFFHRDTLDIGIGTGRTSRILAAICKRYVGIDYSEAMVRFVKRELPTVEVELADMRELRSMSNASFDFAFASNNVIDAVSHEDRLKVLKEVRRVLRSDGLFAFTTHNRSADKTIAPITPQLQRSRNPYRQLSYLRHFLMQQKNFRKLQPFFLSEPEYEIHNDTGHDFSLLHYYIDRFAQQRQLEGNGFELLDVIHRSGESLSPNDAGVSSPTLMYVAKRVN